MGTPFIGTANPATPALANLFGLNTVGLKSGGFTVGQAPGAPGVSGGVFGPQTLGQIGNFINAPTSGAAQLGQGILNNPAGLQQGFNTAQQNIGGLLNTGRGTLTGLLESGLPTDIEALIARSQNTFQNKFIPSLLESRQFSQGGGISSSGLANTLAREAGNLSAELGAFDFQAQESARGRQANAVNQLGGFAGLESGLAGLPLDFANQLFSTAGAGAAFEPGARQLDAFLNLLGASPALGFSQLQNQVEGSGSTFDQFKGALATSAGNALGQTANPFDNLSKTAGSAKSVGLGFP